MVLIDVLNPIGEPGNRVVVDHLFPRPGDVRFGDGLMLTYVNRDVLGTDAFLGVGTSDEWDTQIRGGIP